ncbi:MAG TPA: branched-chain amino acid ABC transporter permease [Candidatus Methylomirabilis sp.]|jgi:branched-chain amino acid transport system permease protein
MRPARLVGIGAAVCVLAAPAFLSSYYLGLLTKMLIFALFAMSLDLLLGYTGLPSLGHVAYFGLGAYTVGLLSLRVVKTFWINALAGLAAPTLVALGFNLLTLRARGTYFLMITLALAQVLWGIAFGWRSFTGGDDGLPGIARPTLAGWSMAGEVPFHYFVAVVFGVCLWLLSVVVRSPLGRALVGIRESETRMGVLGYNVWAYQYVASILAAFFAGAAGILFVYYNGYVGPAYLSVVVSGQVLLMVILGGAGTLLGPALGAAIIVLLENFLSAYTERWLTALGIIYVVVTLYAPRGVLGILRHRLAPRGEGKG